MNKGRETKLTMRAVKIKQVSMFVIMYKIHNEWVYSWRSIPFSISSLCIQEAAGSRFLGIFLDNRFWTCLFLVCVLFFHAHPNGTLYEVWSETIVNVDILKNCYNKDTLLLFSIKMLSLPLQTCLCYHSCYFLKLSLMKDFRFALLAAPVFWINLNVNFFLGILTSEKTLESPASRSGE